MTPWRKLTDAQRVERVARAIAESFSRREHAGLCADGDWRGWVAEARAVIAVMPQFMVAGG